MGKNWKKIIAAMGIVILIAGQGEVMPVYAENVSDDMPNQRDEIDNAIEKEEVAGNDDVEISTFALSSGSLLPAENLTWSKDRPGEAVFYNPNEENVSFVLQGFRGNEIISTWNLYGIPAGENSVALHCDIMESGSYTYQIKSFAYGEERDDDFTSGCVSEMSSAFQYERPGIQVGTPQNISCDNEGNIMWEAVEHAWAYNIQLYHKEGSQYIFDVGSMALSPSRNYVSYLAQDYDYYVRVRAFSENINIYANGDWSDYLPLTVDSAAENVNQKLDEAVAGKDTETAV